MGKLISIPQAAERMGLSRQRVHAIVKAGGIKAKVVGCQWRIDEGEVERYMAEPHHVGRPRKDEG